MSFLDRIQHTFPFIGGVTILIIGAHFGITEVEIIGMILAIIGFVRMSKGPAKKEDQPTTITGRARRIDP